MPEPTIGKINGLDWQSEPPSDAIQLINACAKFGTEPTWRVPLLASLDYDQLNILDLAMLLKFKLPSLQTQLVLTAITESNQQIMLAEAILLGLQTKLLKGFKERIVMEKKSLESLRHLFSGKEAPDAILRLNQYQFASLFQLVTTKPFDQFLPFVAGQIKLRPFDEIQPFITFLQAYRQGQKQRILSVPANKSLYKLIFKQLDGKLRHMGNRQLISLLQILRYNQFGDTRLLLDMNQELSARSKILSVAETEQSLTLLTDLDRITHQNYEVFSESLSEHQGMRGRDSLVFVNAAMTYLHACDFSKSLQMLDRIEKFIFADPNCFEYLTKIDKNVIHQVWNELKSLNQPVNQDRYPKINQFIQNYQFVQNTSPHSAFVRSQEVMRVILAMGGLVPSQVESEVNIDGVHFVDHLVTLASGEKLIIEYDGPRHFVKDQFHMARKTLDSDVEEPFMNFNQKATCHAEATSQWFLNQKALSQTLDITAIKKDAFLGGLRLKDTSQAQVAHNFVTAPMLTKDVYRKFFYYPKLGFKVLNVPFYQWDAVLRHGRHQQFLRHLKKIANVYF